MSVLRLRIKPKVALLKPLTAGDMVLGELFSTYGYKGDGVFMRISTSMVSASAITVVQLNTGLTYCISESVQVTRYTDAYIIGGSKK